MTRQQWKPFSDDDLARLKERFTHGGLGHWNYMTEIELTPLLARLEAGTAICEEVEKDLHEIECTCTRCRRYSPLIEAWRKAAGK